MTYVFSINWGALATAILATALSGPAISEGKRDDAGNSGFIETFDDITWRDGWLVSNYDRRDARFPTGWRRKLVSVVLPGAPSKGEGAVKLRLTPAAADQAKRFFGSELQRDGWHHYGNYEVYMQPAKGEGLISTFSTYTGPFFDDPHDEIDLQFPGRDTRRVWLNLFGDGQRLPGQWVDLGFDAGNAAHLYRIEWRPDSVTWYVDERQLLHVTSDTNAIPSAAGKMILNIWAGNDDQAEWLGPVSEDTTGVAVYHCVSYRPFDDPGPSCADYVANSGQ